MLMNEVADPSPVIEERLRSVAAQHEPRIEALELAVVNASSDEVRDVKKELRRAKRAYAAARREIIQKLRGLGVAW
jgi:hypothetical protein